MVSVYLYLTLLALVAGERLLELRRSRSNAAWALARGGLEVGQGHYLFMKVLHTGFLLGCAVEVLVAARPFSPTLGYSMLAVVVGAQALRYWAIDALGRYWNVRVIVVPGAQAVRRGPYRFLRHPNYVAVIAEGIALPLVHGNLVTAVVFTLANAALLAVRIRAEEAALARHCHYDERLGDRRRFVPGAKSPHAGR